jgi:CheY-like chemotaxis protein
MEKQLRKILVVEDDQMNALMISAVLEEHGYRVVTAGDGDQGLAILEKTEDIDGIITDIFMPNREGIGFIRAAKSRYPKVKIAAMTGAINYESIFSTAEDFGADMTIKKPFDIDLFVEKIDALLNN